MKEQKGITLVALIITIIVMLILVAVTISIALNGGIFDTARRASKETKAATVKEAMALAKAEALANYYENMKTSGGQITASDFAKLVDGYLDKGLKPTTFQKNSAYEFELTDTADDEVDAYFTDNAAEKKVTFSSDITIATGN